jgi:hypothetical protein
MTMMTEKQKEIISAVVNDPWIKIAGIDADGVLRGKDIAHSKFVKAVQSSAGGITMCSVLFGWDIEDEVCLLITSYLCAHRTIPTCLSRWRGLGKDTTLVVALLDFLKVFVTTRPL